MKLLFSCLIVLYCNFVFAQKQEQELRLYAYNLGFGITSTTISALINKPKGEPTLKCIKNAVWQSAIGSTLQFCGKKLVYQIPRTNVYWWGWASKLTHYAGTSINYNASFNYSFGQYWVLDYGPLKMELLRNNGKFKFQPRFNFVFIYDAIVGFSNNGKIDLLKSIQTGSFTFAKNYKYGAANFYSYYYNPNNPNHSITIAHELVHLYQVSEYRLFNNYFRPLTNKINNKTINNLSNYIYLELPYLFGLYTLEYNKKYYYKNFYEFEAKFFSTNTVVDRNEAYY